MSHHPPLLINVLPASGLQNLVPTLRRQLWVAPTTYIRDKPTFERYLSAMRKVGGLFHKADKVHSVPIDRILVLFEALYDRGFRITPHPHLLEVIRECVTKVQGADNMRRREALAKTKLYPFQQEGVLFLEQNPHAMLIDDMGLGKTVQALTALPHEARAIVVCPAVMKAAWAEELAKWRPDLTVVTSLTPAGQAVIMPAKGEVVITNYERLPEGLPPGELSALTQTTLIADEAHYLKNYKALRTQRFRKLAKHAERVWLLTGTPLLNKAPELWTVLQAAGLGQKAYGSYRHFCDLFGMTMEEGYPVWRDPKPNAFEGLQRVSLRRTKAQVLPDLPAKTYRTHTVGITATIAAACEEGWGEYWDHKDVPEVWATLGELVEARKLLAMRKYGAALALVGEYEANEQPLVVFSAHKKPIELLGQREGWAHITGDVSQEDRDQVVRDFQGGYLKGIALTIQAGGVGITLTNASHMLFIDTVWTPALNTQAEDRIHRISQRNACTYTHLVADHDLDRMVHQVTTRKAALIDATVGKVRAPDTTDQTVAKLERLASQLGQALNRTPTHHA